jgi:hypothetical protein
VAAGVENSSNNKEEDKRMTRSSSAKTGSINDIILIYLQIVKFLLCIATRTYSNTGCVCRLWSRSNLASGLGLRGNVRGESGSLCANRHNVLNKERNLVANKGEGRHLRHFCFQWLHAQAIEI